MTTTTRRTRRTRGRARKGGRTSLRNGRSGCWWGRHTPSLKMTLLLLLLFLYWKRWLIETRPFIFP